MIRNPQETSNTELQSNQDTQHWQCGGWVWSGEYSNKVQTGTLIFSSTHGGHPSGPGLVHSSDTYLYKACGKWSKLCRQGKYIYKGTNWDSPSNKEPSWAVLTCHIFFVLCWWLHSLCLNCVIIKMGNYLLLSTSKTLKEIKQDTWESTANFEEPRINGTGYYYFTHRKGII